MFVVALSDPLAVAGQDLRLLLLLGLVISPVAWGLITVGPHYLPTHEVGLLILGEALLGGSFLWERWSLTSVGKRAVPIPGLLTK